MEIAQRQQKMPTVVPGAGGVKMTMQSILTNGTPEIRNPRRSLCNLAYQCTLYT